MTDILNPPTGSTVTGATVKASNPPVRHAPKRRLPKLLKHFLLITCGIVMLYPVLWMIVSSMIAKKPDLPLNCRRAKAYAAIEQEKRFPTTQPSTTIAELIM